VLETLESTLAGIGSSSADAGSGSTGAGGSSAAVERVGVLFVREMSDLWARDAGAPNLERRSRIPLSTSSEVEGGEVGGGVEVDCPGMERTVDHEKLTTGVNRPVSTGAQYS